MTVLLDHAALVRLATAPSSPARGDTYYDTTIGAARTWTGVAWFSWS